MRQRDDVPAHPVQEGGSSKIASDGHARVDVARQKPQRSAERAILLDRYDAALTIIGEVKAEAGPTLRREIEEVDRFRLSHSLEEARGQVIRTRLGHRSGLLRLLRSEFGKDNPATTSDRALSYIDLMLRISANVSVLSGSGWQSTSRWFERRLPSLTALITVQALRDDFDRYVADAAVHITTRIASTRSLLLWGPRPAEIATELGITTAQLRAAGANRCGLTSIDPEGRAARNRRTKEEKRRAAGMKPQSERNKTALQEAQAAELGISLSTLKRRLRPLNADPKVAPTQEIPFTGATFGSTPLSANENEAVVVVPDPEGSGFTGAHVTISASEVRTALSRFPDLRDDFHAHLAAIDTAMAKTTTPYRKVVLKNLWRDRSKLARKQRRAAGKAAA